MLQVSRRVLSLLLSGLLVVGAVLGATLAQVPYVALGPGPTFDTLGVSADGTPVISIDGREVFPTEGQLDLTTVGVDPQLTLFEALVSWVDADQAVVPRDTVYPPGQSDDQVDAANAEAMVASQSSATSAALDYLEVPVEVSVRAVGDGLPADGVLEQGDELTAVDGQPVTSPRTLRALIGEREPGAPVVIGYSRDGRTGEAEIITASSGEAEPRAVIGIETDVAYPFNVTIALEDVGGPSAGLMFALGIVDKLTPGALTDGRYVAGTGEIDPEGAVGAIGGILQKLDGARGKGATVFLVPADNCTEALRDVPDGLQLVRVATLTDAVTALETLQDGGTPPGC